MAFTYLIKVGFTPAMPNTNQLNNCELEFNINTTPQDALIIYT